MASTMTEALREADLQIDCLKCILSDEMSDLNAVAKQHHGEVIHCILRLRIATDYLDRLEQIIRSIDNISPAYWEPFVIEDLCPPVEV